MSAFGVKRTLVRLKLYCAGVLLLPYFDRVESKMSFDLLIFDPSVVSYEDRAAFIEWYLELSEWEGEIDYADPSISSASLSAWYSSIIEIYPPLNGPDAPANVEDAKADFTFTQEAIYVSFHGVEPMAALAPSVTIANANGLGLFLVSSPEAEVLVPDGQNTMRVAHKQE